jgi:hypothetical protein
MKALATSDIDPNLLEALRAELAPDIELAIDERSIAMKSVEPPSWIQFFAEAPWWAQALGAYAAIYVAELVKEAGKETWKQRANLASRSVSAANGVVKLARSLLRLRAALPGRSKLVLGLPVPDDYFGVRFELVGREEAILSAEIALFVSYIPFIEKLIETESLRNKVTGSIILVIQEDFSLRITWMDRHSLTVEERVLSLTNEA